jgi:hypothetical protein
MALTRDNITRYISGRVMSMNLEQGTQKIPEQQEQKVLKISKGKIQGNGFPHRND